MSLGRRAVILLGVAILSFSARAMFDAPARASSRDVRLPKSLVARIERDYREFLKSQKVLETERIKRTLLDVTVDLVQEHKASLYEDVRISTPLGGGVIDLAEHVTAVRGGFKVRLTPTVGKGEPLTGIRVFYISDARVRKLAGEDFGAGCGQFMEITGYFNKSMTDGGFDVYTADQRYVSVLNGTFVITKFDTDSIRAGSVKFTDSRYPEMSCD
jgi:hypothetical protein